MYTIRVKDKYGEIIHKATCNTIDNVAVSVKAVLIANTILTLKDFKIEIKDN